MPRAHLSKRLDDATAIRLFAEHHIVHVRRRKNGEIVAVKHATFGWISPTQYYALQKVHDLMPLIQEFIRGGYQAKAWLWSTNVSVLGVAIPVGSALPVIEAWNLWAELNRTKVVTQIVPPGPSGRGKGNPPGSTVQVTVPDIHWDMVALRAYALLGPFGDVIQIIDSLIAAGTDFSSITQDYEKHPFGLFYWGPLLDALFGPPPV